MGGILRYPNPIRTLLKSYHPIKIKSFLIFIASVIYKKAFMPTMIF
ncbi:hypothetical protein HPHPH3_1723 [Helicobacter pylori Hp H-3]|nr:hypothetical protein HPHPH3_1723 [Helicobacter pylori Hp H-3]